MKFTFSWLKDHLDTQQTVEKIAEALTDLGLEVEQVTDNAKALAAFTVAEILHAEKHPQADKLQVCKVKSDAGELQIVCGAPNARAGLKVALAKEGALIPVNGMVIKKTKIRGVESTGMLCSERELGLGNDSNGIMELSKDAPIGESIVKLLGLDDAVFEIAITPNRGDCLGVRGIARDLAAAGMGTLKPLVLDPLQGKGPSPIKINIDDSKACPYFIGTYIKGVKNGPSPEWLQRRLKAIGLRPISALVDITNYINFDFGRPLHVYDADKLQGHIHVRSAAKGEKLKALNDVEYTLEPGMVVIADEKKALGLGGIIGGTETGCTESTTNVLLEAALFDPINIAQTGRKLQVDSDARYRFERGVDPEFIGTGVVIAIKMITELCGGSASESIAAGIEPVIHKDIRFNPDRIWELGGTEVSREATKEILEKLGFVFKSAGDVFEIRVPSWRPDISQEADIVEEELRVAGYYTIPATPLPKPAGISKAILTPRQRRLSLARRLLAARGLTECHTWSFISEKEAELFGGVKADLKLLNPISADLAVMRGSLLPNLIAAAKRNTDRGFAALSLFEAGTVFSGIGEKDQQQMASGIRSGKAIERNIHAKERAVDAIDAKADAFAVLAASGMNVENLQLTRNVPGWYHPGRSGGITLGGKIVLGYFGELHPSLLQAMNCDFPIVGFELFIEAIPLPKAKGKAKPVFAASDFQSVTRDFAFIVDASVSVADLLRAAKDADKVLVTAADVFDIYQGKGVEDGKKSVAISVTLQAADRTLTDAEIEAVAKKVVENAGALGAKLRT